jgi:hypothetical protein
VADGTLLEFVLVSCIGTWVLWTTIIFLVVCIVDAYLMDLSGSTASYIINFVTDVPFHIVILLVIQRLKQTKTFVVCDQSFSCLASYLILQHLLFKVYFLQLFVFCHLGITANKIEEGT